MKRTAAGLAMLLLIGGRCGAALAVQNGSFDTGLLDPWTAGGTGAVLGADGVPDSSLTNYYGLLGPGDTPSLANKFLCDPTGDNTCLVTFVYQFAPRAGDNEVLEVVDETGQTLFQTDLAAADWATGRALFVGCGVAHTITVRVRDPDAGEKVESTAKVDKFVCKCKFTDTAVAAPRRSGCASCAVARQPLPLGSLAAVSLVFMLLIARRRVR